MSVRNAGDGVHYVSFNLVLIISVKYVIIKCKALFFRHSSHGAVCLYFI